ncbi:putative late blight resistance protein homolog R1A-3 [Henckelia pumila]|uniref:putative late blight resistance protein homolog R1A-3 n=1 Tax=Henckelia pumila TaxID=405737 RepID=UPI003C6DCB7D
MAAVYAALLSAARSLHHILNLKQRINDPLHKEIIHSLIEKVDFILAFLEDYSDKNHGKLDCIGGIREAAYESQNFIDSYLCSVSKSDYDPSSSKANCNAVPLDQDLNMALERISFIWEDAAMKIKNSDAAEYLQPVDSHSSPFKITAKNMLVGFEDDLNSIKERLYEDSSKLQIIPIVGMGGIGKTTLARRAYEDSLFAHHFDICAWITVSAEYEKRDILAELLQSFKKYTDDYGDEQSGESEGQLGKRVYQNLVGRRYLLVIDDIWSTKAWDDLKMIFPDNGSGSRILLTTRLLEVGVYAGTSSTLLHQMRFLSEDQSWELLKKKIFGHESCPLQLVEIGQKIARKCGGLPLMIMVVGGLLHSAGDTKKDVWENVLENITSTEPEISQHCSKILCLSYDLLPLRLKPCFLYIAAFPEDFKIDVSKLIKLWVAEGFVKPSDGSKCLEDVGDEYLDDLVNRSLILATNKELYGKLKSVGIHDLLRDVCITKAVEEGFLYEVSKELGLRKKDTKNPNCRLSIHYTHSHQEKRIQNSRVRAVLVFTDRFVDTRLFVFCRRLIILDAPDVVWLSFLDVLPRLVNLRYIAFALNDKSSPNGFPISMSKLPNLETIIANEIYIGWSSLSPVPYEIWGMPQLRHLIMGKHFRLSYPSNIGMSGESDLRTLETVVDFSFTEDVVKVLLVNLSKLRVKYDMKHHHNWDDFKLENLFHLQNLKELHVSVNKLPKSNPSITWNHAFPISLKMLTLRGVPFLWENMTIIGSLPNLEVLQMTKIAGTGRSKWTPVEGQFLCLKHFHSSLDRLVSWEAEKEHFPSLESLILWEVYSIDEIPSGIGEIDSLQRIELFSGKESLVDSARRIQEQQHENGNDDFQVLVHHSKDFKFEGSSELGFYKLMGWENQISLLALH